MSVQEGTFLKDLKQSIKFQYILCVGSSGDNELIFFILKGFQYILCVGSSLSSRVMLLHKFCFNTSYVSVQARRCLRLLSCLRGFNTSYVSVQEVADALNGAGLDSFNTSYVSVQAVANLTEVIGFSGFNTSYVSVQGNIIRQTCVCISSFQYILCVGSRICSL